jgi:hypothetical protein
MQRRFVSGREDLSYCLSVLRISMDLGISWCQIHQARLCLLVTERAAHFAVIVPVTAAIPLPSLSLLVRSVVVAAQLVPNGAKRDL